MVLTNVVLDVRVVDNRAVFTNAILRSQFLNQPLALARLVVALA